MFVAVALGGNVIVHPFTNDNGAANDVLGCNPHEAMQKAPAINKRARDLLAADSGDGVLMLAKFAAGVKRMAPPRAVRYRRDQPSVRELTHLE